jgi:hypothetical protein
MKKDDENMISDLWIPPDEKYQVTRPGVPHPDKEGCEDKRTPFRTNFSSKTRFGSRYVRYTGVSGIVIDAFDYKRFREYVREKIFDGESLKKEVYEQKKEDFLKKLTNHCPHVHVPYKPTSQVIDYALSIIWPGQSWSSISLFRGNGLNHRRLSLFHTDRFQALSSKHMDFFFAGLLCYH